MTKQVLFIITGIEQADRSPLGWEQPWETVNIAHTKCIWTLNINNYSPCMYKRGITQEIKMFHKADKARKVWGK